MKIDFLIPSYLSPGDNRHFQIIKECLIGIQQTAVSYEARIILVDNGSDRRDLRVLPAYFPIEYLRIDPHESASKARNAAWIYAETHPFGAEYFVWIDDDVIPKVKDFALLLVELLDKEHVISVPMTNYSGCELQQIPEDDFRRTLLLAHEIHTTSMAPSLCYAMSYESIRKFIKFESYTKEPEPGLFDPNYLEFSHEDADYCYRVTQWWKKKIIICPSSFVYHYGGATFNGLPWDKRVIASNCIQENMKYYSLKTSGAR